MKVVYFAPYSAIWLHSIPEAMTASALQERGHDVVYVTCNRAFNAGCISMSIYGVDSRSTIEHRNKICKICHRRRDLIQSKFNLSGHDLSDLVTSTDLNLIESVIQNLSFQDYSYELDGVKLGRAALYCVILSHKKTNLNFTNKIWAEYLIELKHTIYSYLAAKNLFQKEKPDSVVIYNTRYPTNNAVRLAAIKAGVEPYFMHTGPNIMYRLDTLQFGKNDHSQILDVLLSRWSEFKAIPCSKKSIHYIRDHFLALCSGKSAFVYSKASNDDDRDLRQFFGVKKEQKICVAIMSSSDEHYAQFVFENFLPPRLKDVPFKSQEEWFEAIIKYFKKHSELFLIIRVHPRIFPNDREGVESEYASLVRELFTDLPSNVVINWPEQKVSLYDIANITDLFLNSWSSVGKEMALLGIPVLSYGHSWLLYPFDLNLIGDTKESYFMNIHEGLNKGWDFELARKAFRWYALEQIYALIDVSSSFKHDETPQLSIPIRIKNKIQRTINADYQIEDAILNYQLPKKQIDKIEAILKNNWDTPLDCFELDQLDQSDDIEETTAIQDALDIMIKRISGECRDINGNSLRSKFLSYVEGRSDRVHDASIYECEV